MVHPTPTKVLLTTTFEPLERLRRNALAPSALVPSAGGSGKLKMTLETAAERSAAVMHQVRWWHLGQRAMGVRFYAGQYAAWHHMIDVREFMGHEPLRV